MWSVCSFCHMRSCMHFKMYVRRIEIDLDQLGIWLKNVQMQAGKMSAEGRDWLAVGLPPAMIDDVANALDERAREIRKRQ